MKRFATLIFCFVCFATIVPRHAITQQPQQDSSAPFQIHFFAPVDYGTVNQLIGMIDQQIKLGRKDFIILISSPGGDPSAGFAAYSYLHGLPANVTTYNLGDVDSAANLIFCAGKQRYALPGTRFLIHGTSYSPPAGTQFDVAGLDAQTAQIKNLNDMMATILGSSTKGHANDIEAAIHSQRILGPDEAKSWGLIQDIKTTFVVPGAVLATISPTADQKPEAPISSPFSSISGDGIAN